MTWRDRLRRGEGFAGALTLLFVVLKLAGIIDWSWWFVAAPALLSLAVALAGFAVFLVATIIGERRR